jgi:import receptor subunit TOM70
LDRFLIGDVKGAEADLLQSLVVVPSYTLSRVELANIYMDQMDADAALKAYEDAMKLDPNDPDIYYQRGQGSLHQSRCDLLPAEQL